MAGAEEAGKAGGPKQARAPAQWGELGGPLTLMVEEQVGRLEAGPERSLCVVEGLLLWLTLSVLLGDLTEASHPDELAVVRPDLHHHARLFHCLGLLPCYSCMSRRSGRVETYLGWRRCLCLWRSTRETD